MGGSGKGVEVGGGEAPEDKAAITDKRGGVGKPKGEWQKKKIFELCNWAQG